MASELQKHGSTGWNSISASYPYSGETIRGAVGAGLHGDGSSATGILVTIRHSKTDQQGRGLVVAVAHGTHAATDPVAALTSWRRFRGDVSGALFTRIWASRISETTVRQPRRGPDAPPPAVAAGLDGTRIPAHSLRAGHATAAALAGVPLDRIAAQTRHKDLTVLVNRYIPPLEALATTSSKDLGL